MTKDIDKQIFVTDDVEFYPYNAIDFLAYNKRNNKKIRLSLRDVENALLCDRFQTINNHIIRIIEEIPEFNQTESEIRLSLNRMFDAGLMITPEDAVKLLCQPRSEYSTQQNPKKNDWVLAICSADRSNLVARLLQSLTPYLEALPQKPMVILIDDSREEKESIKYNSIIHEFCQKNTLNYEYWSRNKREKFCLKLSEEIPKCEQSINYLLSPHYHPENLNTIGQARNFALIRSIEKPLLMIDDDCLISPLSSQSYRSPELSLGYSGRRGLVKQSHRELFSCLEKSSLNPLTEHLNILGENINQELLSTNPLSWINKPRNILFNTYKDSFIAISVNAIAGALNSRQMGWFYQLEGNDLEEGVQLLASLNEDANIEQATWNGKNYDEVSKDAPFIGTTICGVHALELIPPMPPTGRNEDLALGATINFIVIEALLCEFSWGLPHLPEPTRKWQPFNEQSEPTLNSTSFYIDLLHRISESCPYKEPIDRLNYLASYMKELAESEIIQLTKDMLYKHHSKTIKNLKKSAHHTEYSSRFQVANQKAVEYQLKSIKELETTIIKLAKETTEFMGDFSSALSDWPVIRSYCKHSMPTFTL